ncbi:Imidazolonepropionase [wastewater metagenome]|uniref:Imidazolonepropionase n=3 Tax=root TaxID=1 RepID=A0A5B8RI44_9ZZZZ|nr:imidazolonepropionase [uncultured organism]
MSETLFTNVNVLDSTGSQPYAGEVLVRDNRIAEVAAGSGQIKAPAATVVNGSGATLMSGLCDAHTHLSWIDQAGLDKIGIMPVEEHILAAAGSAKTYLDSGYTMCCGAAAAKPRLDVVIRDAINSAQIPGPRYLANGPEISTIGGLGDVNPSHINAYSFVEMINGPEEMRRAVRMLLKEGVDQIKLNLSGENITGNVMAEETTMSDEEAEMAVREARRKPGVRVCAHARSNESIRMCLRLGVDIIYHASFVDEETLDMLEEARDRIFVAPGIGWLVQTAYGAGDWGLTPEIAADLGYVRELEAAIDSMKRMIERGVKVLPGGDYGFAWTPHGTYAKDLEYFVDLLGLSPMDTLVAATRLGGEIMKQPDELGQVRPGFLADLILVDGDPLKDIRILQDHDRLLAIMKDGQFHKAPSARMSHQQEVA